MAKHLFIWTIILIAIGFAIPFAFSKPAFEMALPGYRYHFPKDHASHNGYKTEWWYYTGHLKTREGKTYGYELTFFRANPGVAVLPTKTHWALDNVYLTHFAVSDENNQRFFNTQTRNRGVYAIAGADTKQYDVWNENAHVKQVGNHFVLSANTPEFGIQLQLTPEKPVIIHGENGVSQKASCTGCASHYYSFTRLKTEGIFRSANKTETVTGLSWMDHEFGSNQLANNQQGWDWFSIQLDNKTEFMLYQLRLKNGQRDPNSSGTWVDAKGKATHLSLSDFEITPLSYWKSPNTQAVYPIKWRIHIPGRHVQLIVTPRFNNQELVTTEKKSGLSYWEGSSQVRGYAENKAVQGLGYVEMTGYASPFQQKI